MKFRTVEIVKWKGFSNKSRVCHFIGVYFIRNFSFSSAYNVSSLVDIFIVRTGEGRASESGSSYFLLDSLLVHVTWSLHDILAPSFHVSRSPLTTTIYVFKSFPFAFLLDPHHVQVTWSLHDILSPSFLVSRCPLTTPIYSSNSFLFAFFRFSEVIVE